MNATSADPRSERVAYFTVLAPSFHGATTISALLNNHPQIVSLGDTNPPRVFEHHECTCGVEIKSCPFWVSLRGAMAPFEQSDTPSWFPTRPRFAGGTSRADSYIATAASMLDAGGVLSASLGRTTPYRHFLDYLEKSADFVRMASGKPVYVDGEKSLTKYLAGQLAGLKPRGIVHIFRDPRAFAASSKRVGVAPERAAREWRVYHARLTRLTGSAMDTPVKRFRYEDFSADPKRVMAELFSFMGVANAEVFYRPKPEDFWHQTGNRTILKFNGDIRESDKWRTELTAEEAQRVLELCGPLAKTYGYR